MLDFYVNRRDFDYGNGFISPDNSRFVVNIPKNASSFTTSWLSRCGWTYLSIDQQYADNNEINELIIILRDPVDRWVSGVSQFIKGYILESNNPSDFIKNYNVFLERILFSSLDIFDDHVWPQHVFFNQLLSDVKRKYIYISEHFEFNLQEQLSLCPIDYSALDFNRSDDDQDLTILKEFFKNKLENDKELHQLVKDLYKIDYDIIENNYIVY